MPNLLLIAGTGQNVGKTTLACSVVERFSKSYSIVAIKVSSHFHKNVESGTTVIDRDDLYLAEESNHAKSKDSSRFLAAGALRSYFVMASDHQLPEAIASIRNINLPNVLFVCESGGVRNWFIPGIFLMMHRAGAEIHKQEALKWKGLCDKWITFDGKGIDFSLDDLYIHDNIWHLR